MKRSLLLEPLAGAAAAAAMMAVFAGCAGFDNMRGDTQYGADEHMKNQVTDALKKDPLYKFPDVSVSVYRDNVQLDGVINVPAQRQAAVKDASSVPGVLKVEDNMMLTTNPPVVPE